MKLKPSCVRSERNSFSKSQKAKNQPTNQVNKQTSKKKENKIKTKTNKMFF